MRGILPASATLTSMVEGPILTVKDKET